MVVELAKAGRERRRTGYPVHPEIGISVKGKYNATEHCDGQPAVSG
jgi:hypothetical protein